MKNESQTKEDSPPENLNQKEGEILVSGGTSSGQTSSLLRKRKFVFAAIAAIIILAGVLAFYSLYLKNPKYQILATVNGEKISLEQFNKGVAKLDPMMQEVVREEPAGFLENGMVTEIILLQEAKKEGISPRPHTYKNGEKALSPEESILAQYFEKKFPAPPEATSEEIEGFYKMFKDQMGGKSLKEMTPWIKQYIQQAKEREAIGQFLAELRRKSKVDFNQKLLQKISAKIDTEEDFKKAIAGGKPVFAEFGSNTCPPCIKMRPFLKEIRNEYPAKAKVLIIDVNKYQKLAQEYKVTALPTLIFFDSKGKEAFRSVGFMEKEKIVAKLKEIGMGS